MRHGAASRRSRGRGSGGNKRGTNQRAQVFDSNGPDVRIRGTAYQVCEKYAVLAKDAASSGDLILSESYLQHAEHYQRMINSWSDNSSQQRNNANTSEIKPVSEGNEFNKDAPVDLFEKRSQSKASASEGRELAEA